MLLAQISVVDYAVLVFYLLVTIVIGAYFSRGQHNSRDFFLAGRSMGWFPVGLSIMATLLSALSYTGVPSEAYDVGLKILLYSVAIWFTLPLMLYVVAPLFHGLELYSVYEYLEFRFNLPVRMAASVVFIIWRLLWLGGVLYAPCKVVQAGMQLDVPVTTLMIILGAVGTVYTFLGGMKAVIWTDVVQSLVMVTGVAMIIGFAWYHLDGGAARVTEVARLLGRSEVAPVTWDNTPEDTLETGDALEHSPAGSTGASTDEAADEATDGKQPEPKTFWSHKWLVWSMIPHMFFAYLSFYIADQITAQRILTARNLGEAKRSFVLNCISVTVMMSALMYAGISMLAYYYDHPESMRLYWIIDGTKDPAALKEDRNTGELLKDPQTGVPYIQRDMDLEKELPRLIERGAVLRPNTNEPFESIDELTDPETGQLYERRELMYRLAEKPPRYTDDRRLQRALERPEHKIQRQRDAIMPWFIVNVLPVGVAGLIFAALLAASMSSLDSGLNSISTLVISDIYRRLGFGRRFVAGLRNKSLEGLDDGDELWLARGLVLLIGVAAILFGLAIARIGDIFEIMISVCNTFGAPLLAVFLLGMFTRRTSGAAALLAMAVGMPFTVWLSLGKGWGLWPAWLLAINPASIWAVTFGVLGTMLLGYVLSFLLPQRKSRQELEGLVVGIGKLGRRRERPTLATDEDEGRWREE